MKYKVEYCGFVIVETDDVQEALEKVQNFVTEYEKHERECPENLFREES